MTGPEHGAGREGVVPGAPSYPELTLLVQSTDTAIFNFAHRTLPTQCDKNAECPRILNDSGWARHPPAALEMDALHRSQQ